MSWKKARNALTILALGATALGCAEERDPINRVQANALAKSFFVGPDLEDDFDNPEFYANGTLLDVGYGAAQSGLFTSWYANDLSIIRWEITEGYLIGRLNFERIEDSDGKGGTQYVNNGQVVYSFAIQSHFDIRRDYNPSTGEEFNVVGENTTDRPWYQREYMRVDWSQNMIEKAYDFDNLAVLGVYGVNYSSMPYYVSDPKHEHAPRFEPGEGYFDITVKSYAEPREVDLSRFGWGNRTIPACFFDPDFLGGNAPAGNCNPHELTIRHSFWRVQDTDYEPQDWDGYRFQIAGAFTKQRYGFSRNYGMTDDRWHRFISRYNIWERSHHYDNPETMEGPTRCFIPTDEARGGEVGTPPDASPTRDIDRNGTHDECESVGNGSKCDTFSQKCTLPYAERTNRPIVWYFTDESDYDYYDSTYWATEEWDVAIRLAVRAAQNAECYQLQAAAGADQATAENTCENRFPIPHGQINQFVDMVAIERVVDTCRKENNTWDIGPCENVIVEELEKRGYQAGTADYVGIQQLLSQDDSVVLCHSPIQADDHPLCAPGKPRLLPDVQAHHCQDDELRARDAGVNAACDSAYTVRNGDVRFHLVNVVESPETPSPWGFGPTFASPTTGEAISASINVWSTPTELISQSVIDVSRFIAGELNVNDVTDGTFVKDWAAAADIANNGGVLAPITKDERRVLLKKGFEALSHELGSGHNHEQHSLEEAQARPEVMRSIQRVKQQAREVREDVDSLLTSPQRAKHLSRMDQLVGTELEAELMTAPMSQLLGANAALLPPGMASPLQAHNHPGFEREMKLMKDQAMADRGACMMHANDFAPSPTAMVGLTDILQEKFGAFNAGDTVAVQLERADRMQDYIAQRMHFSVMIHEMGHTFGLRHNFVSSSNAFFYRPQYWQLRTRNGQVTEECTNLANSDDEAANCIGPRYFDIRTQNEQNNLIEMWAQSSTMDYAGDNTQDFLGLGAYDFHAVRMFYGETATVFQDGDLRTGNALATALQDTLMDSFGGILGYQYEGAPREDGGTDIHYTQLQNEYNLISNCRAIEDPFVFRPSDWDEALNGLWHPTLDGFMVQVDGQYTRCEERRVSYVPYDTLANVGADRNLPEARQPTGRVGPSVDTFERTRVPYGFATDRWADLGNLAVYRHDNGADAYELFNFFITEQELRHIFTHYRRDRTTFSVRGPMGRTLNRYNAKMRDGAKGLGLIANIYRDIGRDIGVNPQSYLRAVAAANGWEDNLIASAMAFDHFTRLTQRPNAGVHVEASANDTTSLIEADEFATPAEADVIIPDGPQGYWNSVGIGGKVVANQLSDEKGEYDSEFVINSGSYYEKVFSPMMLAESADNFISSDLGDFTDARQRAVSMADLFPNGFRRWLANNMTNDTFLKGPRIAAAASGRVLTDSEGFPTEPLGWTQWWGDSPRICFPGSGTMVCSDYDQNGVPFEPNVPANTRILDGQVKWEQQKFLYLFSMLYIVDNQRPMWTDMMQIYRRGEDADPQIENRIELHLPDGRTYVAPTHGTETICLGRNGCQTVQRGIGARILEYGNQLLRDAYETTEVTENGVTWYVPVVNETGQPQPIFRGYNGDAYLAANYFEDNGEIRVREVTCDPDLPNKDEQCENAGGVEGFNGTCYRTNHGDFSSAGVCSTLEFDWRPDCSPEDLSGCTCDDNSDCLRLEDYNSVVDFSSMVMNWARYRFGIKGIF